MCCPLYYSLQLVLLSLNVLFHIIVGSVDMLKDVVVVLVLLLILAGDVELNPGPGKCELYTNMLLSVNVVTQLLNTYSEGTGETKDSIISS